MSNNYQAPAFAGQVAKGGESLARASGEINSGVLPVMAGMFVALAEEGVKVPEAVTDTLAGVVVHSPVQNSYESGELVSVMHVGHGDAVWAVLEGSANRGDKVNVRMVAEEGKPAGAVLGVKVTGKTAASELVVLEVAGNLVKIGCL